MADARRVVEKLTKALEEQDVSDSTWELLHDDAKLTYPQSGEIFIGKDTIVAMMRAYPGKPSSEMASPHGGEQEVHVSTITPFAMPTITITGSGDTFFVESLHDYPDGSVFHGADIVKVRDDKIFEWVAYFAAPFDAPDWRKPYKTG